MIQNCHFCDLKGVSRDAAQGAETEMLVQKELLEHSVISLMHPVTYEGELQTK